MVDPLAGSPWSMPQTVQGFVRSLPNETLLGYAASLLSGVPGGRLLDIGCGAGRNAVPLAELGWRVVGTDLSWPMIEAGAQRAAASSANRSLSFVLAPMDQLPVRDRSIDLIVAHGIWNLASSTAQFRRAVAEASRVAAPGAGLFVFTFSRHTLGPEAEPIDADPFAFSQFSGTPQCFLTKDQLVEEMTHAGFALDGAVPFAEHNVPPPGTTHALRTPVLLEAAFRRTR
jgi:SAM-dependent methyltransferase